jgi:hypothetical protein
VNFELSGGAAGFLLLVFDCALATVAVAKRSAMESLRMRISDEVNRFIGV